MPLMDKARQKIQDLVLPNKIAAEIDSWVRMEYMKRKSFERRWYNNNFFDDGFHFRYVSRETGRVVDLSSIKNASAPKRNIPKASRQIRGIANLLLAPDYVPVVFPEELTSANYQDDEEFKLARKLADLVAKKQGLWLREEWLEQELLEKLVQMVILTTKHGISFLQIYPDTLKEIIRSKVYDAFDITIVGDVEDIYDAHAIIKCHPRPIVEIQADDNYDLEVTAGLHPDNKLASSEVKQAYKASKYGAWGERSSPTIIEKEAFIKEYLSTKNIDSIMEKFPKILEGKKLGDMVMRHVFTAGGIVLKDEYIKLDEYPFVDFRFEPGELYQTPLIERFMGANKSLDILVSRIEKWSNTMAGGSWSKRKGEEFSLTNDSGGVVYEYEVAPPIQNTVAPLPNTVFNLVNLFETFIEEQGASTSALGKLPQGVKSGVAIESMKATEFDNLTIPVRMLKQTIRRISDRMLDYGADNMLTPQTVTLLEKGEPTYFDIIGERGAALRQELGEELPIDTIIIKKGTHVRIEVESGLGFTIQGKKETAQQILDYMIKLVELQVLPLEAIKIMTEQFLRIFQFGATQEFMEEMDRFIQEKNTQAQTGEMTPEDEKQIEMIKVGVLEALDQAGEIGDKGRQQTIEAVKIGFLEVMEQIKGNNDTQPMHQMEQPLVQ